MEATTGMRLATWRMACHMMSEASASPPGLLMRRMRALQSLSLATSLSWLSTCRAIQDQSVAASAGHRIGRRQCRGMPLDCLQADAAVSWSWPQLLQQYKQIVKAGPLKE